MTRRAKPEESGDKLSGALHRDAQKRFENAVDMAVKFGPLPTVASKTPHKKRESLSSIREKSR